MQIIETHIKDLLIFEPNVFGDNRGFFMESFNQQIFEEATGGPAQFVQDNHSKSSKGVLRGLHYQIPPKAQGKLVRVVSGAIFDVAIDIREGSATFGEWFGIELNAENKKQLWVPAGFAHGFITLSDTAELLYKTTDFYAPDMERCIKWDDTSLSIDWPFDGTPLLSEKDKLGVTLEDANYFRATV